MNEIATLESVRDAVETLRARNESVTASAIIAEIGGGSKTTVLKHLREIRRTEGHALDELSSTLLKTIKPMLVEIYYRGAQAEEARTLDQTQRLHRVMDEQDEQIDELMSELSAVISERDALVSELDKAKRARSESEERFAQQAKELEQVRTNLVVAQNEQSTRLLEAFTQIETLHRALFEQTSAKQAETKLSAKAVEGAAPIRRPRGRPAKVRPNAQSTPERR